MDECATLIDADFFLSNAEADFISNARLYLFETYCRIHERISLSSLAAKLGLGQEDAEKWVVKMVSDAQLAAKIDSKSGHVILGVQPPDVYQQARLSLFLKILTYPTILTSDEPSTHATDHPGHSSRRFISAINLGD